MFGWGKKEKKAEPAAVAAPEKKPAAAKPAKAAPAAVAGEPAKGPKPAAPDDVRPEDDADARELKVKVAARASCQVTLSVQVPPARVARAVEESFLRVQAKAKLPGFRPGKAPLEMVRKNFEGAAREDALDHLLRRTVFEALRKEKVEPVVTPTVGSVEYDPGKALKFEVKAECAPEVTLKTYKGLALTAPPKGVADEDVAKRLEEMRETHAKLVEAPPEEPVGPAHFVVVDYVGTLDGLPIEGGRAEQQLVDMSAPQTIAGFTGGLAGAKAGETREVPVKFPEDHPNKTLAGKPVLFRVTVTAVKSKQFPALDDEFAKDVGCAGLDDLRDRLRKAMTAERERSARQILEKQVSDRLLETHAFEVPPSLVEERAERLTHNLKHYLQRQGASEEDWKANEEKMRAKNRVEAERQVRLSYLLAAVAKAEAIDVTDADLDETVRKAVDGVDPARRAETRKWMAEHRDEVHAQLQEERIFARLIEKAAVTEKIGAS